VDSRHEAGPHGRPAPLEVSPYMKRPSSKPPCARRPRRADQHRMPRSPTGPGPSWPVAGAGPIEARRNPAGPRGRCSGRTTPPTGSGCLGIRRREGCGVPSAFASATPTMPARGWRAAERVPARCAGPCSGSSTSGFTSREHVRSDRRHDHDCSRGEAEVLARSLQARAGITPPRPSPRCDHVRRHCHGPALGDDVALRLHAAQAGAQQVPDLVS